MTPEQAVAAMENAIEQLRALAAADERRRREILADRDLTEEARQIALRRLREENHKKRQKLMKQHDDADKVAAGHARTIRANSNVDPQAQARVHELRRQGHPLPQQYERAKQAGDAAMLFAIRAEAVYHGDGKRFAEGDELIRACDQALADLGHTPERLIVQSAVAKKGYREVAEFAAKSIEGTATPSDRLRMAYAVSERERERDSEARGRQRSGEEA